MSDTSIGVETELTARMRQGSKDALATIFADYRERLRRIIQFRIDYRIAARVSDSDILQDTYIAAAKRLPHFSQQTEMSAFLWLRLLAKQQLVDIHRQHLKAEKRDARKEMGLQPYQASAQTSMALAVQLVGSITAASEVVARAETIALLEASLNEMDETDREVIALRHFEELTNIETASVLNLQPSAASKRYLRAMSRLSQLMSKFEDSQHGGEA
ncbi:MAG: sigma-70 family RNA polymerase sigma factor [Rubripirellula sp.]